MRTQRPSAMEVLLETTIARGVGAGGGNAVPLPPRPPEDAPRRPGRRFGWVAAAAVVAGLAVGLVGVAVLDADPPGPAVSEAAGPETTVSDARRSATSVPVAEDVEVVDGVDLERRSPPDLAAAYRTVAPDDGVAAIGPAMCAQGAPEERSWSRPTDPDRGSGRYRCLVDAGRAQMWWTDDDEGVLVHATAVDDDLAALFAWWLAHADT